MDDEKHPLYIFFDKKVNKFRTPVMIVEKVRFCFNLGRENNQGLAFRLRVCSWSQGKY